MVCRARAQELGELGLASELGVQAVRAQEQSIATSNVEERGVDRDHVAQADGVGEPATTPVRATRGPAFAAVGRVRRVVFGDLQHRSSSRQVDAAVARVRHERVIARQPHHVERRAHARVCTVLRGVCADEGVRPLDGLAQSLKDLAARGQVRTLSVVFDGPLRAAFRERRAHRIDRELCGHLAGLMSAHAVGHGKHRQIGRQHRRVLVTLAFAADVLGDREVHAKIEAGSGPRARPLSITRPRPASGK